MKMQIYILFLNILIFYDDGVHSLECFQFDGIYGCGDNVIEEPTECRNEQKICSYFFLEEYSQRVRIRYYETEGCFRRQRNINDENNGITSVVEFVYRQSVKALRCKSLQRNFKPVSYCCCQPTNNGCNVTEPINDLNGTDSILPMF